MDDDGRVTGAEAKQTVVLRLHLYVLTFKDGVFHALLLDDQTARHHR